MSGRKDRIKRAIFIWPYYGVFVLTFVLFTFLNIYLNQSYYLLTHLFGLRLWFAVGFATFWILISFLVALNFSLAFMRFKDIGGFGFKEGGTGVIGAFVGVLGGGCAACFAGVFPLFMGLLGISVFLTSFPLSGLEIQILSSLILIISTWMLSSNSICEIKSKKGSKKK